MNHEIRVIAITQKTMGAPSVKKSNLSLFVDKIATIIPIIPKKSVMKWKINSANSVFIFLISFISDSKKATLNFRVLISFTGNSSLSRNGSVLI